MLNQLSSLLSVAMFLLNISNLEHSNAKAYNYIKIRLIEIQELLMSEFKEVKDIIQIMTNQ